MREFNYLQLSQPKVDFQLYATNMIDEKLILPTISDEDPSIKEFLITNKQFFTPVYPLPAKIIYKIYLDDGHTQS